MSLKFYDRHLIITDLETTGLDPRRQDIIEIGAIRVDQEYLEEQARFDMKVQIQNPTTVQLTALQVNGYTEEAWRFALPLASAMQQFSDFATGGVLAAWNITFEYGFLSEAFRRAGLTDTMDYHRIDIPTLAWNRFTRLEHLSQNDVAALLGLDREPEPHRAITGAEYAWSILRELKGL